MVAESLTAVEGGEATVGGNVGLGDLEPRGVQEGVALEDHVEVLRPLHCLVRSPKQGG